VPERDEMAHGDMHRNFEIHPYGYGDYHMHCDAHGQDGEFLQHKIFEIESPYAKMRNSLRGVKSEASFSIFEDFIGGIGVLRAPAPQVEICFRRHRG